MPIDVERLKEVPEENCYIQRPGLLQQKIIEFLLENKGTAYTSAEINEELNKQLKKDISVMKQNYTKGRVNSALFSIIKHKKSKAIKRKGSYYYWEE